MDMRKLIRRVALLAPMAMWGCGESAPEQPLLEPRPTCIAYCANVIGKCDAFMDVPGFEDVDEASCQQTCERNLRVEQAITPACGDAVEAVFVCASELDCEDVDGWIGQEPAESFPCRSSVLAADTACGRN
jgi:hypothetical protein